MGIYEIIQGGVKFRTNTDLQNALNTLKHMGHMDDEHIWTNDVGTPRYNQTNATLSYDKSLLVIPKDTYRNFADAEDSLIDLAQEAVIVSSNATEFTGTINTTDGQSDTDLSVWAPTQGLPLSKFENDGQHSPEKRWRKEVVDRWHSVHSNYTQHL